MIPCFVINLPQAVERRANMERQLEERGIKAEFIQAVDGRRMSEEERSAQLNMTKMQAIGWQLSPAEIGCALSHLVVYRMMLERNLPYALILEDDVELAQDIADLLTPCAHDQFEIDIPSTQSHMVQLSYVRRAYRAGYYNIENTRYMRVKSFTATWSCSAYIITQAAARKLLDELYPVWSPADDWNYYAKLGWVEHHAITPNPAWESVQSSNSAIGRDRSNNPHPERKGMMGLTRRLFIEGIVKTLFVEPLDRQEEHKIIPAKRITSNASKKTKRLL